MLHCGVLQSLSDFQDFPCGFVILLHKKLTWQWKIHHLKKYFLLKTWISNAMLVFRGVFLMQGKKPGVFNQLINQRNVWVFSETTKSGWITLWDVNTWKEKDGFAFGVFFSVIFVTLLMACVWKKHPRGREQIEVESLFAWKTISWRLICLLREKSGDFLSGNEKGEGWEKTHGRKFLWMMKKMP